MIENVQKILAFFIWIPVLIWLLFRYIRKYKKNKREVSIYVSPDPAHVVAFRELEKLKDEKLWQKGEIKKYYTRLTEILRQYLEKRYGVYSMEMTTSETLESLVNTGFRKDESYTMLRSVLTGADLVKFAKYKPEPSENELNFEYSWDFVSSTKEEETVPESVNGEQMMKKEGL